MENRALGKGLSALITQTGESGKAEPITFLKTEVLHGNEYQPRTKYDEQKLSELIQSVKTNGILQPLLVRPKNGVYHLIAGERRLRAARANNIEEVPVVVRDVTDKEALVLALVENIQREDLNPLEEANAFQRLIEEFNLTHEAIAQSVSKDRSTVSNSLRLLKLPDEIKNAIVDGLITMGHARALINVDNSEEQMSIFQQIINSNLTVREVENQVKAKASNFGKRKKIRQDPKDSHLVFAQEDLQRILGTKVKIISKKKRGSLIIEFYSSEDLDRILNVIKGQK